MTPRILALLVCVGLLGACGSNPPSGPAASEAPAFLEPTPANLYVSKTTDHLFVAWSVPRDLTPLKPVLGDKVALEALVARTVVRLCAAKRTEQAVPEMPCKLQLLRLGSNDEYSKSASGAWTTAGKFKLPSFASDAVAAEAVLVEDLVTLKQRFERFDLRHEELE